MMTISIDIVTVMQQICMGENLLQSEEKNHEFNYCLPLSNLIIYCQNILIPDDIAVPLLMQLFSLYLYIYPNLSTKCKIVTINNYCVSVTFQAVETGFPLSIVNLYPMRYAF